MSKIIPLTIEGLHPHPPGRRRRRPRRRGPCSLQPPPPSPSPPPLPVSLSGSDHHRQPLFNHNNNNHSNTSSQHHHQNNNKIKRPASSTNSDMQHLLHLQQQPQPREFKRSGRQKLLPLSIDDNDNDDDDDETERFLLEEEEEDDDDVDGRRRRRRTRRGTATATTVRTHHFRLPSVQLPSSRRSNIKNSKFWRIWGECSSSSNNNCSSWMYCCTFIILLISLVGYFGGGNGMYYYDRDHDSDATSSTNVNDGMVVVWQKDKDSSFSSSSSSSSFTTKTTTKSFSPPGLEEEDASSRYYDYNFQPTIRNDYSNVSSLHDLFELSTQISVHCSYNLSSSCPCQPVSLSSSSMWSSSSSSSSFDDRDHDDDDNSVGEDMIGNTRNGGGGVGTSNNNINSRLVPRPGHLDGWETAFIWNVQTAASKRGTDSNIVFVGDSITELWRGTQLGQQFENNNNDRKKPTSIVARGGGDVAEIARTFDDLFRTTIRTDKYSAEKDSDSNDDDDDDFNDDEEDYNTNDEEMDDVDKTDPAADVGADEENPSKEISFRGLPLGVAGDQTTNLLWRMQNGELTTNLSPSIFVVLIGTNDLSYDQCSAENIIVGILQCVEYLLEERPDAQILLHGLLPRTLDRKGYLSPPKDITSRDRVASKSPPTYFWSTIKVVNSELKRYADRRQSVEHLDSSDLFLKRRNQIDLDLVPDGTHPSTEGYQLFGSNLQKKILEMMLNKEEDLT